MKTPEWLKQLRTCVTPEGRFTYGIHNSRFTAANFRQDDHPMVLGLDQNGQQHLNTANFPAGDVEEPQGDIVFEIFNPFPFRGATFICRSWAQRSARNPADIALPRPPDVSMHTIIHDSVMPADGTNAMTRRLLAQLPASLQLALATTSTDSRDLEELAGISCRFIMDNDSGRPTGLHYRQTQKDAWKPEIYNHPLFEAVANNPHLPDDVKQAMVLRPGVQGNSEIVGDFRSAYTHVFEYLRRNSYIPWGHYAANLAHDAVRYAVGETTMEDMRGLRHLYYQRTYARMAEALNLETPPRRRRLTPDDLETLRRTVAAAVEQRQPHELPFTATLWGWNYGFDYAPTGYRLHASHQQIHQQFALVPESIACESDSDRQTFPAYACGDQVQQFCEGYRSLTGKSFFDCYLKAVRSNRRMDGRKQSSADLVVFEDERVMLFVPKAQTSQWELQLMTVEPVGNILEADTVVRQSLDQAMFIAMKVLAAMGARMVTVLEYSKRFYLSQSDQRLLYIFLPRLPESPGAFSEAQLRWINGHYPEDFATACRLKKDELGF